MNSAESTEGRTKFSSFRGQSSPWIASLNKLQFKNPFQDKAFLNITQKHSVITICSISSPLLLKASLNINAEKGWKDNRQKHEMWKMHDSYNA